MIATKIEPYTPCPCGGTTEIVSSMGVRIIRCSACDREWDIFGKPIENDRWLEWVLS